MSILFNHNHTQCGCQSRCNCNSCRCQGASTNCRVPKCRVLRQRYGTFSDTFANANLTVPFSLPPGVTPEDILPIDFTVTSPMATNFVTNKVSPTQIMIRAELLFPLNVRTSTGEIGTASFTIVYERTINVRCLDSNCLEIEFESCGCVLSQSFDVDHFVMAVSVNIVMHAVGCNRYLFNTLADKGDGGCASPMEGSVELSAGVASAQGVSGLAFINPVPVPGSVVTSVVPLSTCASILNLTRSIDGGGILTLNFDAALPVEITYTQPLLPPLTQSIITMAVFSGLSLVIDLRSFSCTDLSRIEQVLSEIVLSNVSFTLNGANGQVSILGDISINVLALSSGAMAVCVLENDCNCSTPLLEEYPLSQLV